MTVFQLISLLLWKALSVRLWLFCLHCEWGLSKLSSSFEKRPMSDSSVPAHSVNGQCLDILGKFTIRLGKQVWQQEAEVLQDTYQPAILGWNVLIKHCALLDLKNKVLQLWDMKIPLLPEWYVVTACCDVSVLTPTKIPAMSETLITACVSPVTPASPLPTDRCGVVIPSSGCDIMVAHSLSEVQNGTTVVPVLNPSRDDTELHSGQHLGVFHSASSVDIIPFEETCGAISTVYDIAPTCRDKWSKPVAFPSSVSKIPASTILSSVQ